MRKKKYIMFIDETGTSTGDTPFTVTGVIMEHKYCVGEGSHESPLQKKLAAFKEGCFSNKDIHLHLKQILQVDTPFSRGDGVSLEQIRKFWTTVPKFLGELDFTIISVTVDKEKLNEYYLTPKDPYAVAFAHILEAFYSFINLNNAESARIVLESRDDNQNLIVQKAFFDIFNAGTVHLNVKDNSSKIKGFIFADKRDSKYQWGLEIADLVCNPLSRARRGLREVKPKHYKYPNNNPIFIAIKNKIFIGNPEHDFRNWGFKKVPIIKRARPWQDQPV